MTSEYNPDNPNESLQTIYIPKEQMNEFKENMNKNAANNDPMQNNFVENLEDNLENSEEVVKPQKLKKKKKKKKLVVAKQVESDVVEEFNDRESSSVQKTAEPTNLTPTQDLAPISATNTLTPLEGSTLPPISTTDNLESIENTKPLGPVYPKLPKLSTKELTAVQFGEKEEDFEHIQPVLPQPHTINMPAPFIPPIILKKEPTVIDTNEDTNKNTNKDDDNVDNKDSNKDDNENKKNFRRKTSSSLGSSFDDCKETQNTYLIWSICSTVIFFPILLWIPALLSSLKAKELYKHNLSFSRVQAQKKAKLALKFNIICLIIGVIVYLIAIIVPVVVLTSTPNQDSSSETTDDAIDCGALSCYTYCRIENSAYSFSGTIYYTYWTCYTNYEDYYYYQNDLRYLDCKRGIHDNYYKYACQ